MKIVLRNTAALADVPLGFTWESGLQRAGFFQTLLFALATGDWNSVHVNPLTMFFFKSNLGGMTCPGDLVLSLTKRGIFKMFHFSDSTEIIAFGYGSVEFKRPLRVLSKFKYRYTLEEKTARGDKVRCVWKIQVLNEKGKEVCSALWRNEFLPVMENAPCFYTTVTVAWLGLLVALGPLWQSQYDYIVQTVGCEPDFCMAQLVMNTGM